jgi:ribonuclease
MLLNFKVGPFIWSHNIYSLAGAGINTFFALENGLDWSDTFLVLELLPGNLAELGIKSFITISRAILNGSLRQFSRMAASATSNVSPSMPKPASATGPMGAGGTQTSPLPRLNAGHSGCSCSGANPPPQPHPQPPMGGTPPPGSAPQPTTNSPPTQPSQAQPPNPQSNPAPGSPTPAPASPAPAAPPAQPSLPPATPQSPPQLAPTINPGNLSTSFDDVMTHISNFGKLPDNFITKTEAKKLGWKPKKGNLADVAPGKSIGGDPFANNEGRLPNAPGRQWYEADINYTSGYRGDDRIVYSNDGLFYKTSNHYITFTQIK